MGGLEFSVIDLASLECTLQLFDLLPKTFLAKHFSIGGFGDLLGDPDHAANGGQGEGQQVDQEAHADALGGIGRCSASTKL